MAGSFDWRLWRLGSVIGELFDVDDVAVDLLRNARLLLDRSGDLDAAVGDLIQFVWNRAENITRFIRTVLAAAVSYTHLTLPTIQPV